MSNIFGYFEQCGNKSFSTLPFNDADNIVFATCSYLNFEGIIPSNYQKISFPEALKKYFATHSFEEVKKLGPAQEDSYAILEKAMQCKRYQSVLAYGYEYIGNEEMQFGGISFQITNDIVYVSFEGTDHLMSGWIENFQTSYEFPTLSQKYAIHYLNHHISIFDHSVYVGGHSKGGNLALVGSMYVHPFLKKKIKRIYNNDGPGLRKEEFLSQEYQSVQKRHIHIIPHASYVGILLYHDVFQVVTANHSDWRTHLMSTWELENGKFRKGSQNRMSKHLEKSMMLWIESMDDATREKMVQKIIEVLKESQINIILDLKDSKKMKKLMHILNGKEKELRQFFIGFLNFQIHYFVGQVKERLSLKKIVSSFLEKKKISE